MKRFVVPPNWPTPPRRSWMPPKTWRPDPSWPAAPDDWKFWVDGKGNAVRGPVGRYGGPSQRVVALGSVGLVLFLAVNFWALSAIGLFDGGPSDSQALPPVDDRVTPTPVIPTTPPRTTTTAETSAPPPVVKTTRPPTTPTPTKTKTTKKRQRENSETTPTKPPTTKPTTARPTRTPSTRRPTREEIIQAYCAAQGYDPAWCNPENWPDSDGP
ncbi:hypothetical protein [Kribbella sp. NPDC051620]|uniref:hypothetical protein n=1 Tax=Kribbella sp. NPDC051620 TaxID=3364120 RepID=UPI00378A3EBE